MPFRRGSILVASVALMLCLGATYAWSAFAGALGTATSLPLATVQRPYSLFYFVFPLTVMLAGDLPRRFGPHRCAALGGLLFGGGWWLAGAGAASYIFTLLGIGVFGGVGAGLTYLVPVSVAIRWFPTRPGLVTGLAVAGFGGGSALIGEWAGHLLRNGLSPFDLLTRCAWIFLAVIPVCGWTLRNPPGWTWPPAAQGLRAGAVIRTPAFGVLFLAMTAGLAAGLGMNANLRQIARTPAAAALPLVALFALANAAGRLAWGAAADRLPPGRLIGVNLLVTALVLAAAPALLSSPAGLAALAPAAGLCYGGVLVLYAAAVARMWGAGHFQRVYGWLFASHLPACFAPTLAAGAYDRTGHFALPLAVGAALCLAAAALAFLRPPDRATAG